MTMQERLLGVFQAVFGGAVVALADDDSPETIDGWDSANHVNLILALEAEFGVAFEADEIAELTTVAAITERLAAG